MTPIEHLQEGQKLTADDLVSLFEITLKRTPTPTYLRFTDGAQATWQGKLYEAWPTKFSGQARSADDERSRPTLQIVNPFGIFDSPARKGYFDGATVERRRVLRSHVETNVNISEMQLWRISRVKERIPGQSISFELRSFSDGPDHTIPARKYIPPEFPFVTL